MVRVLGAHGDFDLHTVDWSGQDTTQIATGELAEVPDLVHLLLHVLGQTSKCHGPVTTRT